MIFEKYRLFLERFQNKGYKYILFNEFNSEKNSQLIIRHDIDLDIDLALDIAKIEHEIGAKSTFFFLLRSESYNLITNNNIEKLNKIKELGHQISIHFDLLLYNNVHAGLREEIKLFKSFFNEKIDIISIHRPNHTFLKNSENFFNIPTTYEKKFTNDNIAYYADSGGSFRYGNPVNSDDFKKNKNIQLLIHPIWWTLNEGSVNDCVEAVIKIKNNNMREHFKKNIKTFR